MEGSDPDATFIFYWIAFEAAYLQCAGSGNCQEDVFQRFIERPLEADSEGLIRGQISEDVSLAILEFVANPYVHDRFWDYYNGRAEPAEDWQKRLVTNVERVSLRLEDGNYAIPLAAALERLRVARNQLFHGDATWTRHVDRSQIEDGAAILAAMVPALIHVMLGNPAMFDHPSPYPSVEMDTACIVQDVQDYSIAVNIVRRVREGKERTYSSAELRRELGQDDWVFTHRQKTTA